MGDTLNIYLFMRIKQDVSISFSTFIVTLTYHPVPVPVRVFVECAHSSVASAQYNMINIDVFIYKVIHQFVALSNVPNC